MIYFKQEVPTLSGVVKNLVGRMGSLGQSKWQEVLLFTITNNATSHTMYSFCKTKQKDHTIKYQQQDVNVFVEPVTGSHNDLYCKILSVVSMYLYIQSLTTMSKCMYMGVWWQFQGFVCVWKWVRVKWMTSLVLGSSGAWASLVCLMFSTIFLRKAWLLFSFFTISTSSINHKHLHRPTHTQSISTRHFMHI